jgi:phosphatidylglycerophosphate synthase
MTRGSLVSSERRQAIRGSVDPLARRLARAGLTPDTLTLIGFGVSVAGGLLVAAGWWALGGVVATAGAAFDMLDGAVARVTGAASRFGAFLDSTFDRCGEALVYVGIVAGSTNADWAFGAWLAALAMAAAFLVSYTRARAESLGFSSGTGMAAVGLAPREVRVVILGVGLVGAGVAGGIGPSSGGTGALILSAALALIALLAGVTALQRILFVRAQAARDDRDAPSTSNATYPHQRTEDAER